MNPALLIGTLLAIAGGAGGSYLVSWLQRQTQTQTRTGDAFDATTTALLLTPAAPFAAAAKVLRPFAERGTIALTREFAPKPKPKAQANTKKPKQDCPCEDEAMRNEAGFTSVGAAKPPPPQKPSRYFKQCSVVNGKTVCKTHAYPAALYNAAIARWKKDYAAWEASRLFDLKIAEATAAANEANRRKKMEADLAALKKGTAPAGAKKGPHFGDLAALMQAKLNAQTNPPGMYPPGYPQDAMPAYDPNAYPPGMYPPGTYPQDAMPAYDPNAYQVYPQQGVMSFDQFGFDLSEMLGANESANLGAWDEMAPDATSFDELEGLDDTDVGNADAACCVSCGTAGLRS